MGEICEVCGRISVATYGLGIPGTPIDKMCFRVHAGTDTTCYQVGYERSQAALAAARRECEGLRVDRDHLRAATANANKQTADLNALRLKQDEELVALRDEVRHLRNAMARVRDRSNHGDFYEAMKIADAALAAPGDTK